MVNVTGKWVLEKGQLTHVFAMSKEFLAVRLDLPMRSAHGGEFSSQVSGSAGHWLLQRSGGSARHWQLQRSVGAQWCLRRSAVRCCSTARQRRALAAAAWCWQRQRGCIAARQGRALAAAVWRWQRQRQRGRCSAAVGHCVVFAGQGSAAQRSAAQQCSALAVVAQWRQRSGRQGAAAQWRQRALSAAA